MLSPLVDLAILGIVLSLAAIVIGAIREIRKRRDEEASKPKQPNRDVPPVDDLLDEEERRKRRYH